MNLGVSYKRNPISKPYDAVVVGSGIGGLVAAALLAKRADWAVAVLERHSTVGGYTHTFKRGDWEWDVGVHYIGEAQGRGAIGRLLGACGDGSLAWADMGDIYDRVFLGDEEAASFQKGRDAWRAGLLAQFPSAGAVLDRYLRLVDEAVRASMPYFTAKALPSPVGTLVDATAARKFHRIARRSTHDVLSALTDDARLRAVLAAQWGDYGLPPKRSSFAIHAMVVRHYLEGASYPVGGASRIAASIIPTIAAAGGDVYNSVAVERIVVEAGRVVGVRMADSAVVRAPVVISDAGAGNTQYSLLDPEPAVRLGLADAIAAIGASSAHIGIYLGLDGTDAALGLTKPNLWIYNQADHDAAVAAYEADPDAPPPVVYVSFPSAKDPDFQNRHPGKATIDVIGMAPWARFAPWADKPWMRRGSDYEAAKQALADRYLDVLYRHVPQARAAVRHVEVSTPLSSAHFAAWPQGELYGLDHTPQRFRVRGLKPATRIKGLYLTGSDVLTCGVGGAAFGGVVTASAILRRPVFRP